MYSQSITKLGVVSDDDDDDNDDDDDDDDDDADCHYAEEVKYCDGVAAISLSYGDAVSIENVDFIKKIGFKVFLTENGSGWHILHF